MDITTIDANGTVESDVGRTDTIGWCVPAVPTEDGFTFWGYAIGSDDPYLTTEAFAEPERFTLEQRQEVARALHGQHEEEAVA